MNESERKLQDAYEKFEVLKATSPTIGLRGSLEAAAALRKHVINDGEITAACDASAEESDKRKILLDGITAWINESISQNSVPPQKRDLSDAQVIKFTEAKNVMVEMVEDELSEGMFEESESPELLKEIPDCKQHTATICRVAENCRKGSFLALILGDFQSGKSTTIDALCDGKHISAIGDGNATSAVLIMVSYGEEETLHIHWRAKDQFLPIFERIKRIIPDYNWSTFDLDRKADRQKLAEAIEQVRLQENKPGRKRYLEQADIKFLMLCDLILAFYDTDNLRKKKDSLSSLADISAITRFPKDGEVNWKKDGVRQFTIDEAIFVFIDSVACTTPSETLKELNCTVIDSPGLFNSAYDTMVTESAMLEAHAVIYVLPYLKGIGEDVCKSLYALRNKDRYSEIHKKLFIVNNVDSRKDNTFVESNQAFIKAAFGDEKELHVYDAKVAYLAQLKRRYDMGLATPADYAHLLHAKRRTPFGKRQDLDFDTFDQAWNFWISPYLAVYGTTASSPAETYLIESGFNGMCTALKSFIEKNEAYAIILSNALIPMRDELYSVSEDIYKRYIEPYTKSREELVDLWDRRIAKAEKFQQFATATVEKELFQANNGRSLLDRISEEEYTKIFTSDFYSEIARGIAAVIYDNKGTFLASQAFRALRDDIEIQYFPPKLKFKDNGRFQSVFKDLAFPLIEKRLTEIISFRLKYSLESINTGQDQTITNLFSPVAENIKLKSEREWEVLYKDDRGFDMSSYFTVPKDLSGYVVEKKSEASGADLTSDLVIGATLLGGVVVEISAVVTGIAAMIAGYLSVILCDPTGMAFIGCVLLGIGGLIISSFAGDYVREKFVEVLTAQIEPKIKGDASGSFKKMITEQMQAIFQRYASGRVVDIQKMKNQRDTALTPNPDQELHCFRAIEILQNVNQQLAVYEDYAQTHLKNEAN